MQYRKILVRLPIWIHLKDSHDDLINVFHVQSHLFLKTNAVFTKFQ